MQTFYIQFSDNSKILFDDVIVLTSSQMEEILAYSKEYKKEEIITAKAGMKISLTSEQMGKVVNEKERIVSEKDPLELHQEQIVEFTDHSIDRIIKRYKGNQIECYLAMIDMVKKSTEITDNAEWKGYKSLAYTFLYSVNTDLNKIVLTFVKQDNKVKIVTAMNDVEVDSMDYRLSEDDVTSKMLLQLRNKLKDSYNS